jgi:hypothetical protein
MNYILDAFAHPALDFPIITKKQEVSIGNYAIKK